MTHNEAYDELLGRYAAGDFLREVHRIVSTDVRWDRLGLACGHELVASKGLLMLRDRTSCGQCAKAWVEDHTE